MPVKHKRSASPGKIPTTLQPGEIALNVEDKAIYALHPVDGIIKIAGASPDTIDASAFINETPPLVAHHGMFWWNTNNARLMMYYTDANSSQWIEASPSAAGAGGGVVSGNPVYDNLSDLNDKVPHPSIGDECYVISQGKAVYNGFAWVRSVNESTLIN